MDHGLYSGNYYEYADDQFALEREYDIGESLEPGVLFTDDSFPTDPRSLYYDPLNPPKGSLPGPTIKWSSIVQREVLDCETPVRLRVSVSLPKRAIRPSIGASPIHARANTRAHHPAGDR